jgi:hypothetical protein
VGRQFFVWLAVESASGREIILKQPRFDYRNPTWYARADVERLRLTARKEYDALLADRSGTFPTPLSLLVADSPVPAAARSHLLARGEVFVAEEYVRGPTLSSLALQVWPTRSPEQREAQLAQLVSEFVLFWDQLRGRGWFYPDISADNLLVNPPGGTLRVVDGGSAVPLEEWVVVPGFTPAFTTPRLFEAMMTGRPVLAALSSVLPQLGKVCHFALTGREPLNGMLANMSESSLAQYSGACLDALAAFALLDENPASEPEARAALTRWRRVAR